MPHASKPVVDSRTLSTHQRLPEEPYITDIESRSSQQAFAGKSTSTITKSPPVVADEPGSGAGKVADHIRSINDLGSSNASVFLLKSDSSLGVRRKTPTATSSRVLPFVRRDAMANRQGSANPQFSCSQTHIHSPTPRRVQPELSMRIEDGARLHGADAGEHKYSRRSDPEMRHASNRFKQTPEHNPARNNVICPRHGRSLHPRKKGLMTTTEGLEKSYSGAYIPTGRKLRQQVDALNPGVMFGKCLAKQEGTTVSPEICPDCIAEQNILERELAEELQAPNACTEYGDGGHGSPGFTSTVTEAGTPASQRQAILSIDPAGDGQIIPVLGAAGVELNLHDCGSVIAADLGNMLDAIIIEHSGILDKVITNIRNGVSASERMHKISQDLAKVSDTVATMPEDQFEEIPTFVRDHGRGKHSMVLDMDPLLVRQHTQSIPRLLEFIDGTTRTLGLRLSEDQEKVDEDAIHLLSEANLANVEMQHTQHKPSFPGAYPSAAPTPFETALLTTSGERCHQSRNHAILPQTSPRSPPRHLALLPSETLLTPRRPATNEDSVLPIYHGLTRTPPHGRTPSRVPSRHQTHSRLSRNAHVGPLATEVLERLQQPKQKDGRHWDERPIGIEGLSRVARSHVPTPSSLALALYQTSGAGSRRLVKPSEIVKKQKMLKQESLRQRARASSLAERAERRSRVVGGSDGDGFGALTMS